MPEGLIPVPMARVAVVVPVEHLRDALVAVAASGVMEITASLPPVEGAPAEALRRLEHKGLRASEARLAVEEPDIDTLERRGAVDLLSGEAELRRRERAALRYGDFAIIAGWVPRDQSVALSRSLAACGAALVERPHPPWSEPPTLLRPARPARPFRLLVDTYGAARYRDLDPTMFAAAAFVLMFGMMFGDVGHGLLLATLSIAVGRFGRGRLAGYRKLWPLGVACGLSAGVFGLLYGEAFGPTELVPTLWLSPVDDPLRLLVAGIGVGALLLLCSYLFGTANRWREEGSRAALQAASGGAGLLVFLGGGVLTAGWWAERGAVELTGGLLVASGATLLMAGFVRQAGHGAAAITQAVVESADSVVRVAANIVSFARLAAFGLTHAAIGSVVLDGASALWGGVLGSASAVALLILGNAVAFALEALVAGVQAMRLEYYELFSRVFSGEGHRFSPWTVSPVPMDGSPP